MKSILVPIFLLMGSQAHVVAQSRWSIAPTYWFQHNPYTYQVTNLFGTRPAQLQATGFNTISSVGLVVRYHLTPHWDVALGGLYSRVTNHINDPQNPYGEASSYTSKAVQLPLLLNYRLTTHRLSPYFSAGAFFTKSITFDQARLTTDGVLGMGLAYQFGSSLSLLVQPTASYSFSPPTNNTFYQFSGYQSYNFGLQAQLIWRLWGRK